MTVPQKRNSQIKLCKVELEFWYFNGNLVSALASKSSAINFKECIKRTPAAIFFLFWDHELWK